MSQSLTSDPATPTLTVADLWPPPGQWTETDYFKLPESSRIVELTDGEIFIMPPPSFRHRHIIARLFTDLQGKVAEGRLGTVVFAPVAVRLWPGKIREPDILYYAEEHRNRIGDLVSGPPDLAVEVISPATRKADRHDKFYEYAQAGIAEYWLVEPEAGTVEVFVLDDEVYTLLVKAGAGETAYSRIIAGFQIGSDALFAA